MTGRKRTDLGGGWWMEEPMTRLDSAVLYDGLDADELDELAVVKCYRASFIDDFSSADRSAAFYADGVLVFGIAANFTPNPLGGMGCVRMWDTMSTKAIREHGIIRAFIEHTAAMRDAFLEGEPIKRVIGVVKGDFARSRKWIERCAGFSHIGDVEAYGVGHAVYMYDGEV